MTTETSFVLLEGNANLFEKSGTLQDLPVNGNDLFGSIFPSDLFQLFAGAFAHFIANRRMPQQGNHFVGQLSHIPEINLQGMVKYLGNTGLFRNNYRHIVKHSLERRNAERFRYAGHYIKIAHSIHPFHIFTPQEAGKAELISHLKFSDPFHHSRHHVTSSRHDKMPRMMERVAELQM